MYCENKLFQWSQKMFMITRTSFSHIKTEQFLTITIMSKHISLNSVVVFWRQESTGSRFLASLKNELIIIDLFLTDTSVAKKFREANLHVTTSASFNFEQNLSPEENMEFVHSILSQELYKYGTGSYYRSLFIRVIYFFQNVTLNCYWDLRIFYKKCFDVSRDCRTFCWISVNLKKSLTLNFEVIGEKITRVHSDKEWPLQWVRILNDKRTVAK